MDALVYQLGSTVHNICKCASKTSVLNTDSIIYYFCCLDGKCAGKYILFSLLYTKAFHMYLTLKASYKLAIFAIGQLPFLFTIIRTIEMSASVDIFFTIIKFYVILLIAVKSEI